MSSTMQNEEAPQPVTGLAREPAIVRAAITAFVGVAIAFGFGLTDGQRDSTVEALTWLVIIVLPLVQGWWTRRAVSPTATVAAQVDETGVTRSGPADGIRPNGAPVTIEEIDNA